MSMTKAVKAFIGGGGKLLADYILFRLNLKEQVASSLNMEITARCPLHCKHCYYWSNVDFQEAKGVNCYGELPTEKLIEIFKEYKKRGTTSVVLTGGEPALRLDVVRAAYEIFGTGCIIITNGIIPIPKDIETRIFISLDGACPETHDAIRRYPGLFDRVIKNIEGDDRYVLAPTLSKLNFREIKDMVALAKRLKLKITFSGYTPAIRAPEQDRDPLVLEKEDIEFVIKELNEVLDKEHDTVYMSKAIIELFRSERHWMHCSLKAGWVDSRDPQMRRKTPCVIGENANCHECQCIIPKIMHGLKYALLSFDLDAISDAVRMTKMFTYIPPRERKENNRSKRKKNS